MGSQNKDRYEHWLLHCVFVLGWTTSRCAREVKAKPKDVLRDFNRLCEKLNREKPVRPRFII